MAKQLSLIEQGGGPPELLDCLRYEQIQERWKTTLPADEDIDWCAEHTGRCVTGAHALGREPLEPSAVLKRIDSVVSAEGLCEERPDATVARTGTPSEI